MTDKNFEQWGIVELFGHNKIAGMISEQSIGGCSFIRVDVPEIEKAQSYTKLYGNAAIYAMTFTDEETSIAAAKTYSPRPIESFEARQLLEPPSDGYTPPETEIGGFIDDSDADPF